MSAPAAMTRASAVRQRARVGDLDWGSPWVSLCWILMVPVAFVAVMLAASSALSGHAYPRGGHRFVSLLIWLLVVPVPGMAWHSLQAQCAVWTARLAPRLAVQQALIAWRRSLLVTAALGLLPLWLVAALAPPAGGGFGLALLASAMVLGTLALGSLASAAWRGHVHGAWVLPGWALTLGIVASFAADDATWGKWSAAQGWQLGLLWALVFSPLLAWPMLRDSASQMKPKRMGPSLQHRWRLATDGLEPNGRLMQPGAWGFVAPLGIQFSIGALSSKSALSWFGLSHVNATDGLRLGLFTMLALACLTTGSTVSWRQALAPGAPSRSQLGWQVAKSSAVLMLSMFGLAMAAVLTVLMLFSSHRMAFLSTALDWATQHGALFLAEFGLAIVVATCLRGWAGSFRAAAALLIGCIVLWAVVCAGLLGPSLAAWTAPLAPWMERGTGYLACLLLLTTLGLLLARQAWARADLGSLMRQQRSDPLALTPTLSQGEREKNGLHGARSE